VTDESNDAGISNDEIIIAWNDVEAEDPDKSTEYLFARVRDFFDQKIDDGDIAVALADEEAQKRVAEIEAELDMMGVLFEGPNGKQVIYIDEIIIVGPDAEIPGINFLDEGGTISKVVPKEVWERAYKPVDDGDD